MPSPLRHSVFAVLTLALASIATPAQAGVVAAIFVPATSGATLPIAFVGIGMGSYLLHEKNPSVLRELAVPSLLRIPLGVFFIALDSPDQAVTQLEAGLIEKFSFLQDDRELTRDLARAALAKLETARPDSGNRLHARFTAEEIDTLAAPSGLSVPQIDRLKKELL